MSQPNWKLPLVLAAVLFVLSSIGYWHEFKKKPIEEKKEEEAKKIFVLKDVQVTSVSLHDGTKTFTVNCLDTGTQLCKPGDNSKWDLSEPVKLHADDANGNSLLTTLNNLSVPDKIDLKDETPEKRATLLKEYGLDPASRQDSAHRRVEVTTASNGKIVLFLGQTHPVGDSIFGVVEKGGKLDQNDVYLVPSYFKSNFEHDLTYWRDKKLLPMAAHEIESFDLDSPKGKIAGSRKDGQWTLKVGSENYAGDLDGIDALLSGATYLTAKTFVSDNKTDAVSKKALAGTKKVVSFTVQREKGAAKETPPPVTLVFYEKPTAPDPKADSKKSSEPKKAEPKKDKSPKGVLYATVSNADPLYELDYFNLERLNKSLKDLRLSRLITSMERFTAKRLEFSGKPVGSPPLVIEQKAGKWVAPNEHKDVNQERVQSFLDKISGNRIKDFLQGKDYPPGEQDGLMLKLGDDKSEAKRNLVFWRVGTPDNKPEDKNNKLYAKDLLSQRQEALSVDPSISGDLPWDRETFFKPSASPSAAPGAPAQQKKPK